MNLADALKATPWLPDEFFAKFLQVAARQHIDPLDLAAVLTAESGMRPDIRNSINAQGIFQVIPSTLRSLGWTRPVDEFRTLSAVDQLPWLERYMSVFHVPRWRSAGHYYWANFLPATLGRSNGIAAHEGAPGIEGKAYEGNRGLDFDHKGYISLDDLERFSRRARGSKVYKAIATRLGFSPTGEPGVRSPEPKKSLALVALVAIVLGGWGYIAWENRRQIQRLATA